MRMMLAELVNWVVEDTKLADWRLLERPAYVLMEPRLNFMLPPKRMASIVWRQLAMPLATGLRKVPEACCNFQQRMK